MGMTLDKHEKYPDVCMDRQSDFDWFIMLREKSFFAAMPSSLSDDQLLQLYADLKSASTGTIFIVTVLIYHILNDRSSPTDRPVRPIATSDWITLSKAYRNMLNEELLFRTGKARVSTLVDTFLRLVDGVIVKDCILANEYSDKMQTSMVIPSVSLTDCVEDGSQKRARPDPRADYITSRARKGERSQPTCLDDAVLWKEMLADGLFTGHADLAAALDLTPPNISKTLAINEIPIRLIHRMKEHQVTSSLRVAYEISRIFARKAEADLESEKLEVLADEVIDEVIKRNLSSESTKSLIESRLIGPKKRVRPDARDLRFGEFKGLIKATPSKGTLEISFKNLTAQQLEDLSNLVERALKGAAVAN